MGDQQTRRAFLRAGIGGFSAVALALTGHRQATKAAPAISRNTAATLTVAPAFGGAEPEIQKYARMVIVGDDRPEIITVPVGDPVPCDVWLRSMQQFDDHFNWSLQHLGDDFYRALRGELHTEDQ